MNNFYNGRIDKKLHSIKQYLQRYKIYIYKKSNYDEPVYWSTIEGFERGLPSRKMYKLLMKCGDEEGIEKLVAECTKVNDKALAEKEFKPKNYDDFGEYLKQTKPDNKWYYLDQIILDLYKNNKSK